MRPLCAPLAALRRLALAAGLAAGLAAAPGCTPAEAPVNALELPGLDQKDFTVREKNEMRALLTELYAPCPEVAVPVSQCVLEKRACTRCNAAAKFIYDGVRHGQSREQIEAGYKDRFDPASVRTIPIDGSPVKGPDDARITIVEFADFECPGCGGLAPVLDRVLNDHPGDVRLVYKFYPLVSRHAHAEESARAAIAAMMQGKFWEMHHQLFTNQEMLRHDDLRRYARELNLEMKKFEEDMGGAAATDRIQRDGALVTSLHVDHTPSVFVNGRPVDLVKYNIEELVNVELSE